jgi:SulP family sulfate permease
VGQVPVGVPTIGLDLPWSQAPQLIVGALVIALVGFAEAAAISRTFARETRTRWDADREFVSQGVANVATGLVGAFPVGGSFSRSAVARSAGARTAWSGAITGLVVLAAMPFIGAVERLPTAVLAAIIIVAVAKLADPRELWGLRHLSRQQFTIGAITFLLSLALAPRIQYGVLIGVLLSIGAHLRRELSVATPSWLEGDTLHVRPLGVLFFGSGHRLNEKVDDLIAEHHEVTRVVLHMDRLGRVDVTGAMELQHVLDDVHDQGLDISIVDLTPTGKSIVDRVLCGEKYGVDLAEPPATIAMPGQLGGPDGDRP